MDHNEDRVFSIPLDQIDVHPVFETRHHWTPESDGELPGLAESLTGVEGQISPIIVAALPEATSFGRWYTLIAGRRRLEAARLHKRTTIQARVLPPVRMEDPVARLRLFAIAVAENVHRKNLTPEERREALHRLKLHYEEVYPPQRTRPSLPGAPPTPPPYPTFTAWAAKQFNISRSAVSKDLRLAHLATSEQTATPAEHPEGDISDPTQPPQRAAQHSHVSPGEDRLLTQLQRTTAALSALLALLTREQRPDLPSKELQHFQNTLKATFAALHRTLSLETP